MKLLIITQKVDINDDNLSFFHRWLEKFAEKLDEVFVICLWQGEYDLPQNVQVFSMGKERGVPKIGQLALLQKYLLKILPEVDGVFVHMCPIYAIASFSLTKIFGKKMIMWYGHTKVSLLARVAEKLVSKILTPSKESFVYKTKKTIITGHGVDAELFSPEQKPQVAKKEILILSAGRINPSKDEKTLIEAADILINQRNLKNIKVKILGTPILDYEKKYFEDLKNLVREKKLEANVEFLGGVSNKELVRFYRESDIFVNLQAGGGVGKAVLEAMACGMPIVICTKAYNGLLGDFKKEIIFEEKNPKDLSEKLLNCIKFSETKKRELSNLLRNIAVKHHNLDNLVNKIIQNFKDLNG